MTERSSSSGAPAAAALRRAAYPRGARRLLLPAIWVIIAGAAFAAGAPYYLAGPADRAFSELHDLYAPTGSVGHSLGYVGTLMIAIGVAGYMVRKRMRSLQRLGRLSTWLRWHIFLCTLGPFLVVLHTTFKVGGLVSIAFWAMVAVVLSGVLGRYVYTRLPRRMDGGIQTLETVRERLHELDDEITNDFGLPPAALEQLLPAPDPAPTRTVGALRVALSHDLGVRRRTRAARRILAAHGVDGAARTRILGLLREEAAMELQLRLLHPFQRLFRHWHTFHLPLAIVMLLVVIVHVGVAIAFGYGWPL